MSAEISRREFELLLDEYIQGALPADRAQACDRYLAMHPDARGMVRDATLLLLSPAWRAAGEPPAGLLASAVAKTQARLAETPRRQPVLATATRYWRPTLAWTSLAAAATVAALLLWPSTTPVVIADVLARLRDAESLHVEGWIRGADGQPVPWQQWVQADGDFRAEVGPAGKRSTVVWHDGQRRVRDADGRLFSLDESRAGPPHRAGLRGPLHQLEAMFRDGTLAARSAEYSTENLGRTTRFTHRPQGPLGGASHRRWIVEVDNDSSLPRTVLVEERVAGDWVRVSELRLVDLDRSGDPELYRLDGPALAVGDEELTRLWFELAVSPRSLLVPAATAPAGDSDVRRLTATDASGDSSGGGYTWQEAGVTTLGLYNLSVDNLIRGLAGLPVAAGEIAQRRVSLEVRTKSVLPWQRQVAAALDSLGLRAEVVATPVQRRRFVFRQDGRRLEPSRIEFGNSEVRGDTDGYHFRLEHLPLADVVRSLKGNSAERWSAHDTLEFVAPPDRGNDPFATPVDVEFHNPDGRFASSLSHLGERFGVTMEVIAESLMTWEVRLIEAGPTHGD